MRLRNRCRPWVRSGVLCLLCALATSVKADMATSLSWVRLSGAEACVGGAKLVGAVRERVGDAALFTAPDRAERLVEGHVARVDGGFVATFRVTGADGRILGERELRVEGSDCAALTRPAVLILSVIVKPDGVAEAGGQTSQAEPAPDLDAALAALPRHQPTVGAPPGPSPRTRPAATEETPAVRAEPDADAFRLGLRLAGVGEVGPLPAPSLGASIGVVLDVPGVLRLGLEGGVTAPQQVSSDAVGSGQLVGGERVVLGLQPLWGALLACPPDRHRDGFAGVVCLRVAVTHLALSLEPAMLRSVSGQSWLAEAGLRLGARRRWGGFAAWAELGFGVALRRDTLQFLERSGARVALYRPEPVNLGAHLGMEMTF